MLGHQQPNWWPLYFAMSSMGHTLQDLAMKAMVAGNIDVMKTNMETPLGLGIGLADGQASAGPEGDEANLKANILGIYGNLYDFWKAGVYHGVGAAYSSAVEQLISSGQLLYAYKALRYNIAIIPRIRRHWNKKYAPMEPDAGLAWVLYCRGKISLDQFVTYAQYDGWSAEGAATLAKAMEMHPTPLEAFYLYQKGQITLDQRNALYKGGGYPESWWGPITANWYYVPSLYDLTRLADYVELDQTWALQCMKARGMRDSDIAKIWPALQLRPLREEVRNLTTQWTWRIQYGRATAEDAEVAFIGYGVTPKERELVEEYATMKYEDELITEMVDILTWRFRTAKITEEDFRAGLAEIGIRDEKANLIVELELAKGYTGGYTGYS